MITTIFAMALAAQPVETSSIAPEVPDILELWAISLDLAETAEVALAQRDTARRKAQKLEQVIAAAGSDLRSLESYAAEVARRATSAEKRVVDLTVTLNRKEAELEDRQTERWLWLGGGVGAGIVGTVIAILATK